MKVPSSVWLSDTTSTQPTPFAVSSPSTCITVACTGMHGHHMDKVVQLPCVEVSSSVLLSETTGAQLAPFAVTATSTSTNMACAGFHVWTGHL